MSDNTKYVIVDVRGLETPILFPCIVNHDKMKLVGKVISAGFCQVDVESFSVVSVCVFGESKSLNIKSRKEDAEIIERELNRWKNNYTDMPKTKIITCNECELKNPACNQCGGTRVVPE